jgi:hypothetical protein
MDFKFLSTGISTDWGGVIGKGQHGNFQEKNKFL